MGISLLDTGELTLLELRELLHRLVSLLFQPLELM